MSAYTHDQEVHSAPNSAAYATAAANGPSCSNIDTKTPPMVIDSITPDDCFADGGETLTIAGRGLSLVGSVKINGVACADLVASETEVTCTIPDGTGAVFVAGVAQVDVVIDGSAAGVVTLVNGFSYTGGYLITEAPEPNSGDVAGGTAIVIRGTGMNLVDTVSFIDDINFTMPLTLCTGLVHVSPSELHVTTPPAAAGLLPEGAVRIRLSGAGQFDYTVGQPYDYFYFTP